MTPGGESGASAGTASADEALSPAGAAKLMATRQSAGISHEYEIDVAACKGAEEDAYKLVTIAFAPWDRLDPQRAGQIATVLVRSDDEKAAIDAVIERFASCDPNWHTTVKLEGENLGVESARTNIRRRQRSCGGALAK